MKRLILFVVINIVVYTYSHATDFSEKLSFNKRPLYVFDSSSIILNNNSKNYEGNIGLNLDNVIFNYTGNKGKDPSQLSKFIPNTSSMFLQFSLLGLHIPLKARWWEISIADIYIAYVHNKYGRIGYRINFLADGGAAHFLEYGYPIYKYSYGSITNCIYAKIKIGTSDWYQKMFTGSIMWEKHTDVFSISWGLELNFWDDDVFLQFTLLNLGLDLFTGIWS